MGYACWTVQIHRTHAKMTVFNDSTEKFVIPLQVCVTINQTKLTDQHGSSLLGSSLLGFATKYSHHGGSCCNDSTVQYYATAEYRAHS